MVWIELKWGQRTENVVRDEAVAPIPEVEWMKNIPPVNARVYAWKVAMVACHALVVEPLKQQSLS